MGQPLACGCGPAGAPEQQGDSRQHPAGPLADYFLHAYLAGKAYAGPSYDRKHDPELGADVLEHVGSGIRTWTHACDLRGFCGEAMKIEEDASTLVLFHYTDREGFLAIARSRCLESRVGGSMPFGEGVYMCAQEPEAFGSKVAVLLNNHWPAAGGGAGADAPWGAAQLLEQGASAWGPLDARNHAVRAAVLSDAGCASKADFCVPFLVHEDMAYDIWERLVPELHGVSVGCDRWGERQWPGRDIWVVSCPDDGGGAPSRTSAARSTVDFLERMASGSLSLHQDDRSDELLRSAWLESKRTLGPTHPETLDHLHSLAEAVRLGGQVDEAEVLHRRVLEGREERFGPLHPDTLASADRLGLALAGYGNLDEAESLHRRALEGSEAALGPRHPDSLAYAENLAATLHARAQALGAGAEEEAEALQRRAWEGRLEVFGPHHPDTQASQQRLAEQLEDAGRHQEAAELRVGAGADPSPEGQRSRSNHMLELIEALAPEASAARGPPASSL